MSSRKPIYKEVVLKVAYCPVCGAKLNYARGEATEHYDYECPKCYRTFDER